MEATKKFLSTMVQKLRMAVCLWVEVVDVTHLLTEARLDELRLVAQERSAMTKALRSKPLSGPETRYDIEYSNASELAALTSIPCKFEGTHYWFWSPILEPEVLGPIVERHRSIPYPYPNFSAGPGYRDGSVVDVGAGNGTLLRKFQSLGFRPDMMTGIDISAKAMRRIKETGAGFAIHGGIPVHGELSADVVCLSYFVDRDLDQRVTFRRAADMLAVAGQSLLVLEGLFPCVLEDSSGVKYGKANVTRGVDALEDIMLVVAEFARRGVKLEKVLVGQRLVYSLDGPEVLPSYTLVFRKI